MSERCIIVVAGGPDAPPSWVADRLPVGAPVIAADSGLGHALALGLSVDLVVGDLDSVDPGQLARAEAAGVPIERHRAEKDQTDLALALDRAATWFGAGPERIVVVVGTGGRLDHGLANLLLLAHDDYAASAVEAWVGPSRVQVVRSRTTWATEPGQLVTLLAIGGPAQGIRTAGLVYPLDGETLVAGSSRGVSNVALGTEVTVSLAAGVLLATTEPPQ